MLSKEKKRLILNGIIIILLISLVILIINIFVFKLYSSIFWLCYTGILLIMIGIWKNKSYIVLSQIIILAIPDVLWIIDFLAILITGNSVMNLSNYFFQPRPLLAKLVSLQHLYVIPLALFALYIIKIDKAKLALRFAAVQLVVFLFLSRTFTPIEDNINCTYFTCFDLQPLNYLEGILPYSFGWYGIMFLSALVVYLILVNIKWFKKDLTKPRIK